MVIESSTKLLYASRGFISARSRTRDGKGYAERAEATFSQVSTLSKDGVKLVFSAINNRVSSQGHLSRSRELTEGSQETFLEVMGSNPGSPHAERAMETASYAAGLLKGDIEFAGAKLPTVANRVGDNLAKLRDVLAEIEERTGVTADGLTLVQDGLVEVAGDNGPLDMATHHLRLFRRQI